MGIIPEIIYVEKGEYKEGWGFKPHRHEDYFQLISVLAGSCTLSIDAKELALNAGDVAIIGKNALHMLKTDKEERALVADIKFVIKSGEESFLKLIGVHRGEGDICSGMEFITHEAAKKQLYFKEIIDHRLSELLMLLARSKEGEVGACCSGIKLEGLTGIPLQTARYIEANYYRRLTLDDIAKELGYSKVYICQCFKRQAGRGIFAYLYDVRLAHAHELLSETELSHEEIIAKTGFRTVNHFIRYYKQKYGVSPGRMRKNMRKLIDVPILLSSEFESDLKRDNRNNAMN